MNKRFWGILFFIVASLTQSFAQTIGGIGAQLFLDTAGGSTMPRIMALVPNTPAYDSLKATDYIVKVNGVSCKDKTIEEVVALIRGVAGTKVNIIVADTKESKRPRVYDLPRVSIQTGPAPDPLAVFNADCENEVRLLRQKHAKIIRTFPSDCGNFFFNFDAGTAPCHVRVMTMESKGSGAFSPAFYPTAKVFDNDNEAGATTLDKTAPKQTENMYISQLEGTMTFKRPCIGSVGVTLHDDVTKCKAMYVLIYQ